MRRDNMLFVNIDWYSVEDNFRRQISETIAKIDENRILNSSETDLIQQFTEEFLFKIPVLDEENAHVDTKEVKIDISHDQMRVFPNQNGPVHVPATQFTVTIPFIGQSDAFKVKPSQFTSPPRGVVSGNNLLLAFTQENFDQSQLKEIITQQISEIKQWLVNLERDATSYNNQVEVMVRSAIVARKTKLLGAKNLAASLGFKLTKREGESQTYSSQTVKRKIQPAIQQVSNTPFKPEPTLNTDDYNYILKVLEDMSLVMEKSPSAFRQLNEEALRFHFLVPLNGHFEGGVTGETFNFQGKTDILIKENGKNIFIAECKFWSGAKKHIETIDQLLGYSTWRDTKVAVIVFNRNKDFSNVLQSIRDETEKHPNCKKFLGTRSETSFQYVFGSATDQNREMIVTIMAFDIPL